MREKALYFTEINNITTKIVVMLPNNLNFILDEVRYNLRQNPQYLFCRFSHMNSTYQVNNKTFQEI